MLINFLGQEAKNYQFLEPDAPEDIQSPVKKEIVMGPSEEKEYEEPEHRDNLYRKVGIEISKLKASPDRRNWVLAKDLRRMLEMAKTNESQMLISPKDAAANLHDRLLAITDPKSNTQGTQHELVPHPEGYADNGQWADLSANLANLQTIPDIPADQNNINSTGSTEAETQKLVVKKLNPPPTKDIKYIGVEKDIVPAEVKFALNKDYSPGEKYFISDDGKVQKIWKADVIPGNNGAQDTIKWSKNEGLTITT